MKIIFLTLCICFLVPSAIAGGKTGVPTTLSDPPPPPPPPPPEEVCEDDGDGTLVPAPVVQSSYFLNGVGFGMMSCDGFFINSPAQAVTLPQTVGSGVSYKPYKPCVKRR